MRFNFAIYQHDTRTVTRITRFVLTPDLEKGILLGNTTGDHHDHLTLPCVLCLVPTETLETPASLPVVAHDNRGITEYRDTLGPAQLTESVVL